MHQRDRKRAAYLFRTKSLGKNSIQENDELLGSFEPDWSKFENVFMEGKLSHHIRNKSLFQIV